MAIKGLTLSQLVVKLEQLKRALSLLNTLKDQPYRTVMKSRVFGNMNRVRAAIKRMIKGGISYRD